MGSYAEAEKLYREALAGYRRLLGEEHLDVLSTMHNLGVLLQEEGRWKEAESLYQKAIETGSRTLHDHADLALWIADMGALRRETLDFDAASNLLRQSLEMCRRQLQPGSTREASILNQSGELYLARGMQRQAGECFEKALAIQREHLGPAHPDVASSLFNLAECDRREGRLGEADALYRQALETDEKAFPAGHPQTARHLLGLAELLMAKGDLSAAERMARESLDLQRRILPAGLWQLDAARSIPGAALGRMGRFQEAEPILVQAYAGLKGKLGIRTLPTQQALARVIDLYRAWGQAARAAGYRAMLAH